jgi:hypothetical protein
MHLTHFESAFIQPAMISSLGKRFAQPTATLLSFNSPALQRWETEGENRKVP